MTVEQSMQYERPFVHVVNRQQPTTISAACFLGIVPGQQVVDYNHTKVCASVGDVVVPWVFLTRFGCWNLYILRFKIILLQFTRRQ